MKKLSGLLLATALALCLALGLAACGDNGKQSGSTAASASTSSSQQSIESTLNLANNKDQEWSYSADAKAWVLSIVSAVADPELPDEQGVSVCVPGAYVTGIDTDGDGKADVTASTYSAAVKGALVIDRTAKITSPNGQVYTAATAPVIFNTGAAGYASQTNQLAGTDYAEDGYINVACGNRGKQDTAKTSSGKTYYTGDAPDCLVDQKDAARFVKYNILLGNLPGSVKYFVSTGGSGGAAHATMFAATSNNPDFYPYEVAAGAVGVYKEKDGSYSTSVTIKGKSYDISDGAWGCIAYSAITSLYEGDITMAFEYNLDKTYSFKTSFQKQLAKYLSVSYMNYINKQKLSVKESAVGFDLNGDGDKSDTVRLTIQHSKSTHLDTNGYYGTYLNLYLAEFTQNLQWYLDNLNYAEDWTWFGKNGKALSDAQVAAMTSKEKAQAFIEGRYAKSTTANGMGGPGGGTPPSGASGSGSGTPSGGGTPPSGGAPSGGGTPPSGSAVSGGTPPSGGSAPSGTGASNTGTSSSGAPSGGPSQGTTQSSSGSVDSANYTSYADMVAAYESDIKSIEAGDTYGNNIVSLYNPLNYINAKGTENPTWTRIVMGAAEGDMSMFASLNLEIAWLNAGVDSVVEWQWDGGHVPSEVLGDSFSLYVDEMYAKHVAGAKEVTKSAATKQTKNGTATKATGTDISSWVNDDDISHVSFSLASAAAYRTAGAMKAIPGFDVIDYGQEDYVFGDSSVDARHWDKFVLDAFQKYAKTLEPLFNASK